MRKKNKKRSRNNQSGNKNYSNLLPFETIEAAISGDETAIYEVIKNYGSYIMCLAGQDGLSGDGRNYYIVDKIKSEIMKIALIERIPKFDPAYSI